MRQQNSSSKIDLALATAEKAARKAGKYLLNKQGDVHIQRSKALHDDLLDADLESESIIIDVLRAAFPSYSILSEEAGKDTTVSQFQWIVDPLDGSANFQHGSPIFGISIGLIESGELITGAIYLPKINEMFTAVRGKGAKMNGKPIKVSSIPTLSRSLVHVGDFAKDGNREDNKERLEQMSNLAYTIERIRMVGTAATDLAYVACGRADGFIINSFQPWDIEPGRLLVTEAGGKETHFKRTIDKQGALFSNGLIHQELDELVQGVRKEA